MMLRHPRWIPPARRHSHTSPRSSPQSAGKSCQVVVAATTAVGCGTTSARLTSSSTRRSSLNRHGAVTGLGQVPTPSAPGARATEQATQPILGDEDAGDDDESTD